MQVRIPPRPPPKKLLTHGRISAVALGVVALFVGSFLGQMGVGLAHAQILMGGSGSTYTDASAQAATGWTYNGTQSLAINDIAVPSGEYVYLDGATRVTGLVLGASGVTVSGVAPLVPGSDQGINLGTPAVRWSNLYLGEINMGVSSARTWIASVPASPVACTSPSITHGNFIGFQADVGTSCTGVSTFAFTVSATTNGTICKCDNISAPSTRNCAQTAGFTGTTVTITNFSKTTGIAADFADGADLVITCTGR